MADIYILLASLAVAAVSVLLAIPPLRTLARQPIMEKTGWLYKASSGYVAPIGGYALFLALWLANTYLSQKIDLTGNLVLASVSAVSMALLFQHASIQRRMPRIAQLLLSLMLVLILVRTLLVPEDLEAYLSAPDPDGLSLTFWLLLGIGCLSTIGLTRNGIRCESENTTPTALYWFSLSGLGILILSNESILTTDSNAEELSEIAFEFSLLLGGAMACLFSMTRTTQSTIRIAIGTAGYLTMGLWLTSAALTVAAHSTNPAITTASLCLILGLPLMDSTSRWLLKLTQSSRPNAGNTFIDIVSAALVIALGVVLSSQGHLTVSIWFGIPMVAGFYVLLVSLNNWVGAK